MFKLDYIGHAGWIVSKNKFRIVCDPWFDPSGAYFGEWKQFPDNSFILEDLDTDSINLIYISHVHDDHFDPWFLRKLKKNTKIIIPNFVDKTLFRKLKNIGFKNIAQLDRHTPLFIDGVKLTVIKDESYLDNDSCLLIEDSESKILNLNDCHIDFSILKNIVGDIDLLLLQSSSAIWWPCVYDYDSDTKKKFGEIKRQNILNRAVQYAKTLNAKNVVPNAGPPILVNEDLKFWNNNRREKYNPFILMDDAHKFFIQKGLNSSFFIPGATATLQGSSLKTKINNQDAHYIYNDYESYLDKYQNNFNIQKDTILLKEIQDVVDKFGNQLRKIKKISKFYVNKIDFPVLFDFKHLGKWILDFKQEECFVKYSNQDYSYFFVFEPEKVALLFREESIDFERYFLGCNFSCGRDPDEYNEFLFTLLKHLDIKRFLISESLYAKRSGVLDETFTIEHKNKKLEIQKYCPHMFANLEEVGYIDGDNFVCPLHGWKFNLDSGHCENKKSFCLNINYLDN
jgi:UDP-MurNAc hydroxylase